MPAPSGQRVALVAFWHDCFVQAAWCVTYLLSRMLVPGLVDGSQCCRPNVYHAKQRL